MTSPDPPAASNALLDRLRAEQVRLLYANGGAPMVVTLFTGAAVALLFVRVGVVALGVALAWMAVRLDLRPFTRHLTLADLAHC